MLAVSAPVLAIAEPVVETVETAAPTETPEETEAPVVEEAPAETETPVETEQPVETEEPVAETEEPVAETEEPVETEKPVVQLPIKDLPIKALPGIGEITPIDPADDKPAQPANPGSGNTAKELFKFHCETTPDAHADQPYGWFGSYVTLDGKVTWDDTRSVWTANAKVSCATLLSTGVSCPNKVWGCSHYYGDYSTYKTNKATIKLVWDAENQIWNPDGEQLVSVWHATEPGMPTKAMAFPGSTGSTTAIRVHNSAYETIPSDSPYYSKPTYFRYLKDGTYSFSKVTKDADGNFKSTLSITNLQPYIDDFNASYPAVDYPFHLDTEHTPAEFKWTLTYTGSTQNYALDGSGWKLDDSTSKIAYVTREVPTTSYTITYTDGVDGEEVFPDQVYTISFAEPTPAFKGTPTRTGYTFAGWTPAVAKTVSENATYTAKWEVSVQKYKLTFNGNGGKTGSAGVYTSKTPYAAGSEVNLKTALNGKSFTKALSADYTTNYRQIGWNTKKDGTGDHYAMNDTFVMPAGNTTLYAEWESYEWIHWNAVLGDGGKEIAYSINNVKQSPVQTFKLYTGNVGTGAGKVPAAYYTPVVATAEDGYYCIGWYDVNKDALVSAKDTLYVQDFRNLRKLTMAESESGAKLEARFAKYLTVTYTDGVDGEEVFADQVTTNLKAGDATPAFSGELTRKGYVFTGWTPVVTDTVTEDTTYTATWAEDKNGNGVADKEEDHFTVTYTDGVEDEEIFADQVYADQLVDMPTPAFEGELTREGYVFDGWEPAVAETVTANATYTATWAEDKNGNGKADKEEDHFTVTYTDGVDGEEVFADQVYADQLVDMPTPKFEGEITRKGYVFKGWEPAVAETVTADATYTATWAADRNNNGVDDAEEEHFTVTYTDGVEKTEVFADQVTTDLIAGDATPAFNGTPTRKGYKFKGWEPAVAETVTGNATYTAKWTKVAASDDEDVPKTGDFASAPAALLASSVAFLGLGAFLTAESRKAKKNH